MAFETQIRKIWRHPLIVFYLEKECLEFRIAGDCTILKTKIEEVKQLRDNLNEILLEVKNND